MKCSACYHQNQKLAKYCVQCGHQLGRACSKCQKVNIEENRFCSECGHYLLPAGPLTSQPSPIDQTLLPMSESCQASPTIGERKYVTILFSDLCNYTGITEQNDPEEVKEILNRIFTEAYRIIQKYDGFMERIIGDGAMILFGSPRTHEDDAIRAIRTAIEIHQTVYDIGQQLEEEIGQPLQMHSGISSGLVVTDPANLIPNSQGITGDAANLASRLADIAQPGEILVESNTYRQSRNYFDFAPKGDGAIKGKSEKVGIYRVLNPVKTPFRIHSATGVQAELIGRKAELFHLKEGAQRLKQGKGTIFSIIGEAGTGKSRLMLEFRNQLFKEDFTWIEGHAYAYTHKIPYFPLIDMMERIWGIQEKDPPHEIKAKVSQGINCLLGPRKRIEACIGTLHGLQYPEIEGMGPESWDRYLYGAIVEILAALAHKGKTIFYVEDLHWADTSTIRLLRSILPEFRYPTILLCSYRPSFSLLTTEQQKSMGSLYQVIQLKELSPSESQELLGALLKTDIIPPQLLQFIKDRTEGNPFFLEEMINSLIETRFLVECNGQWQLSAAFNGSDIPATIQGVIASRLDRLQTHSKRLLQEASVIGRSFPYEILKRITSIQNAIETCFSDLERIDLIRTRSLSPDLEFIFKHALTQEVGYNSLLKKDRQEIHIRIAQVMEKLFTHRLSEFYETLALHYRLGKSIDKAVSYLIKAGNKSLKCYALTEAFAYFSDAYKLLKQHPSSDLSQQVLLIDLLNQWAFVYYYLGSYKELLILLKKHQDLADKLVGQAVSGYYYAWLGSAHWHRAEFKKGHSFLVKAIEYSERDNHLEALGFASAWMGWTLTEKAELSEALLHAQQAWNLCDTGKIASQYVHMTSLAAMGYAHWHAGHREQTENIGRLLIDLGRQNADTRALCLGYCCHGWSKLIDGNLDEATINFKRAISISQDPWYSTFPKLALAFGQISLGNIGTTTHLIKKLIHFSNDSGAEFVGEPASFFHGIGLALSGQWLKGVAQMEAVLEQWQKNEANLRWTLCAFILSQIYLKLACEAEEKDLPDEAESRSRMAEKAYHLLKTCVQKASNAGMRAIEGQIWLSMGKLELHLGRVETARKSWQTSLSLFQQCKAEGFHKTALEMLSTFEVVNSDQA